MEISTPAPRGFRAAMTLLMCATMLSASSRLDAQQDRAFREERRITAIDLVLGFKTGAIRDWATDGREPNNLQPGDFEILYDGQPRPVVAVETATGPWQIVIYFDAALTSSAGLRWAAAALAGRSDELTALGEVTLVIADPAPWTMLAPTRDRDRLNASLSQLARFQEGQDELLALRAQAVKERGRAEAGLDADLLAAVAAEEARIVRARHDDLLLELTEYPAGARPFRALILASGGYDVDPDTFYRSLGDASESGADPSGHRLDTATTTLARTLAAYGWSVLPLVPPEADPLKEGIRIGKLRLTGPKIEVERQKPTPTDWEDYDRTTVRLFGARLESQRKPKRAEAFLELGAALHDQGKLADAEDALRQALYHFAGDPRTADRQAAAFARLGAVLEAREQTQEATAALRLARRIDPTVEVVGAGYGPIATLLDPITPLETLAGTTAGGVVRSAATLGNALEALRQRVWLTYQVAGAPDGDLHALKADFKGSRRLVYPAWARSSTPESVSAARVRRLLDGEPTGGDLGFDVRFERQGEVHLELTPPGATAAAEIATEDREDAASETQLRLTLGVGGPDVEPTVEHRRLGTQTSGNVWSYQVGFRMPKDRSWLAVVVEDLEAGTWGGQLIEVP